MLDEQEHNEQNHIDNLYRENVDISNPPISPGLKDSIFARLEEELPIDPVQNSAMSKPLVMRPLFWIGVSLFSLAAIIAVIFTQNNDTDSNSLEEKHVPEISPAASEEIKYESPNPIEETTAPTEKKKSISKPKIRPDVILPITSQKEDQDKQELDPEVKTVPVNIEDDEKFADTLTIQAIKPVVSNDDHLTKEEAPQQSLFDQLKSKADTGKNIFVPKD